MNREKNILLAKNKKKNRKSLNKFHLHLSAESILIFPLFAKSNLIRGAIQFIHRANFLINQTDYMSLPLLDNVLWDTYRVRMEKMYRHQY